MSNNRNTQEAVLIAALWLILLISLSLGPLRFGFTRHGQAGHIVLHLFAFGLTTFIVLRISSKWSWGILSTLFLLSIAAAIELGQSRIYQNRIEWKDVALDACGIMIVAAFVSFNRLLAAIFRWK